MKLAGEVNGALLRECKQLFLGIYNKLVMIYFCVLLIFECATKGLQASQAESFSWKFLLSWSSLEFWQKISALLAWSPILCGTLKYVFLLYSPA